MVKPVCHVCPCAHFQPSNLPPYLPLASTVKPLQLASLESQRSFLLATPRLVETDIMKTYKSITELLAEWIVYPPKRNWRTRIVPLRSIRGLASHTLIDHTNYLLPVTDYLFTGYESPINKLPITCHQPSKSPPNSTHPQPIRAHTLSARLALSRL
jgi:hypothetical protein